MYRKGLIITLITLTLAGTAGAQEVLSLDTCRARALRANSGLKRSEVKREETEALRKVALWQMLPKWYKTLQIILPRSRKMQNSFNAYPMSLWGEKSSLTGKDRKNEGFETLRFRKSHISFQLFPHICNSYFYLC